jgi:hypothetical protein
MVTTMRPKQSPRGRDEIAAEINRLVAEHSELSKPQHGINLEGLNPPRAEQIPAKRKRGRPATGYKAAKWAAEQGVSVRTMERVVRIVRHWPELLAEIDARRLNIRDAERLVLIAQRDPALLTLINAGRMNIRDAMAEMRRRNVIRLPQKEGAH